jgi:hypothetical protein
MDWIGLGLTAHQQYLRSGRGYSVTLVCVLMCPVIADTQDLGLRCLIRKTGQLEKLIQPTSRFEPGTIIHVITFWVTRWVLCVWLAGFWSSSLDYT